MTDRLHRLGHLIDHIRVGAKTQPSMLDVGAAHIDLDEIGQRGGICLGTALHILLQGKAADVGNDGLMIDRPELGQLLRHHFVDARVLQAHGVEHPPWGLRDPGGGVAKAGLPGGPLNADGPQTVNVIPLGKFIAEAKGAAGGEDGVVQRHAAEGNCGIYHRISSFSSTGPSRQMRLLPYLV